MQAVGRPCGRSCWLDDTAAGGSRKDSDSGVNDARRRKARGGVHRPPGIVGMIARGLVVLLEIHVW